MPKSLPLPMPCHTLVDLDELPLRIVRMLQAILEHQEILCAYESGSLELHFNGPEVVKPSLGKVALNSRRRPA